MDLVGSAFFCGPLERNGGVEGEEGKEEREVKGSEGEKGGGGTEGESREGRGMSFYKASKVVKRKYM